MRSLSRSLRQADEGLPFPWPQLNELVTLRPGNLCVVQAAPGVGKSLFALCHALYLAERHKLPSLMISLDTDPRVQALRMLAHLRGQRVSEIEEDLEGNAVWLEEHPNLVRWVWEAKGDELDDIIEAEKVYLGQTPALVVVDNAGDLVSEESAQGYATLFRYLHTLGRRHDTVVLALHHLNRGRNPQRDITTGNIPPFLGEAIYAGEKDAELVLGLWRPENGKMDIGVLKNRVGSANPFGRVKVELHADLAKARIEELADV